MKPKGKREYVKSGGEFVSLSAYIKTLQKKNKKKGGGDGEGDGKYYGPDSSPANSRQSSPRIQAQAPRLPEGWEVKITADNQPYYYNNNTGAATRTNPLTFTPLTFTPLTFTANDSKSSRTQTTRQL